MTDPLPGHADLKRDVDPFDHLENRSGHHARQNGCFDAHLRVGQDYVTQDQQNPDRKVWKEFEEKGDDSNFSDTLHGLRSILKNVGGSCDK
jgi:hypothetical protein